MTVEKLKALACELASISVFRNILRTKPIAALLQFLNFEGAASQRMSFLGEFVYTLADNNYSFSDFLSHAVYEDENPYIIAAAQNKTLPDCIRKNTEAELALFSRLTRLSARELCSCLDYPGYIPEFDNTPIDFTKTYAERLKQISRFGYGIFATAGMFKLEGDQIVALEAADQISLEQFVGYETERQMILDNTQALVDGRPAANALLFGDAGTGKSSTVKACANHFYDQGVRLIELRKDQLFSLSHVMERIVNHPLKFIIFIDDLSFNKNDDCFSMLKAALEGSASAKANNAVIYATSNRRHIVKERFSDRSEEDDIHHSDTVQELNSLSDRFGLCVYFSKPGKSLFLDIVHELALRNGLHIPTHELDIQAEAFALARGSRSPRAAEQFIMRFMQANIGTEISQS